MFKTINKNNWTGKQAKIRISEVNRTVSLYGVCGKREWETFKINIKTTDGFVTFNVTHKDWDYPLVDGYKDKDVWYACGAVERENKCISTAIAQVLYNAL